MNVVAEFVKEKGRYRVLVDNVPYNNRYYTRAGVWRKIDKIKKEVSRANR